MHACERCYSRKTKCDRRLPQCSSCMKSRSSCRYSNKRRDRHLHQEYLQSVELRLKQLEQENKRLREVSEQVDSMERDSTHRPQHCSCRPKGQHSNGSQYKTSRSPKSSTGTIQRIDGGHDQYLGSSNGADFVDIVERVVVSSKPTGGLFGRVTDSRATKKVVIPFVPRPTGLIDQSVALPMIESYFDHWHLAFPLLYRPGFMHLVDEMYRNPRLYQQNAVYAFAIDIVLALGSVSLKRPEGNPSNSDSYFARALTHFDDVSNLRDIRSLQALLLYCKYGIHASLRDTSSEMWELLGRATQLCVEIGLHQNNSTSSSRSKLHITGEIPESVQPEMLRRCFWCYYNLERIVNISLGRPLTLHDDDIHVSLPSALEDDYLEHPTVWRTVPSQKTSPFLHHTRFRKIQSKIHRSMYTSHSTEKLSLYQKQILRKELFDELQEWRRHTSLLSLTPLEDVGENTSSYLHPSWYEALYHSGCLLLFRPSGTFPAMEGLESSEDSNDVLGNVWNSSRLVLAKYSEVLRTRHLNYSWVCLYTIFMAGLANIYSVGCCVQRRRNGIMAFQPGFWNVISDVRDCSNLLTAICERWNDARVSSDIFNQLSMSALKGLATITFATDNSTFCARTDAGEDRIITDLSATTDEDRQARDFLTITASRHSPSQQSSPGLLDIGTTMSQSQYPGNTFPHIGSAINFQQMFQGMQNDISTRENGPTDEVVQGFSQEWF